MQFRFDGVLFFLTYPQSGDLEWQTVISHLESIKQLSWARICKEQHQDGTPHLHVVGKFSSRVKSSNCRLFDVSGKHPNVQSVRSIPAALKYVSKDGQFFDVGTVPAVGSGKRTPSELLEASSTLSEKEYWLLAAESGIQFQYAKKFRELGFINKELEVAPDYRWDLAWETEWLRQQELHERVTVVQGTTGHGKTSFAKRLVAKPAILVSQIEDLRRFVAGYHKAIIFDDMCFTHTPATSQIHLLDWDQPRSIFCRYSNAYIPAHTQKVFTCNPGRYPFTTGDAAIARRISRTIDTDLEFSYDN